MLKTTEFKQRKLTYCDILAGPVAFLPPLNGGRPVDLKTNSLHLNLSPGFVSLNAIVLT